MVFVEEGLFLNGLSFSLTRFFFLLNILKGDLDNYGLALGHVGVRVCSAIGAHVMGDLVGDGLTLGVVKVRFVGFNAGGLEGLGFFVVDRDFIVDLFHLFFDLATR